jgi:TolB-like protein/predicted Ser/Thr protein kinase/Flp pilus assembly protein TadD
VYNPRVDDLSSALIGRTLGHYRIVEKVGAGGMGVVYRAHDNRLDRDVALKVLPGGALADDDARKRFRKEALALSKLNHPNIATVFDFDALDGVDFLVMELVEGESLAQKVDGKALAEKEAAALGAQVADALEEAHERGVVHRDLKPANILVTSKGRIKVLDFGLARLLRPAGQTDLTASLTATPAAAGTLPYMAPEQLQGEQAEARSDIYALGAVLYEMATGRRAFREELSTRLIDAILHQPPVSPRALEARVSPELERIILKCLEKEPASRYQSAKEVGVDLRRLSASASAVSAPAVKLPAAPRSRRFALAAGLGAGALVVLMGLFVWRNADRFGARGAGDASSRKIGSLAVLPLENLSRDPEQDYFADGMTEELTADLAQIGALRVISRTSVMQYKGTLKKMPEIGRELNVDALIEGSVRRAGQRVRITAQLIRAASDEHLWAKSYEGDLGDILTLQSHVAGEIASEIKVALTPQDQSRLASARRVNPEAHEAYLLGRHYWEKANEADLKKSLEYYQKAQATDPNDPLVYAGMADTYSYLSDFYLPPREVMPKATEAATKAIQLDETLAEAHEAMAAIHFLYDWDWPAAEREFKRAIELSPNFADARHLYANFLAAMRRPEEALAEMERAEQLSPYSAQVLQDSVWVRWLNRRYDEAIEHGRAAIAIDPQAAYIHINLGLAYAQKRQFQEAVAEGELAHKLDESPVFYGFLGSIYAQAGKRAEAQRVMDTLQANMSRHYVCPYEIGTISLLLGNKDEAFRWFDKAIEVRSACIPFTLVDPRLDSLHDDLRYKDLLRRLKFPQ